MMKTKLLASGMVLFFLGGCGSKEPDCGSNATVNAVKEIMKERPNNQLIDYVFNNSKKFQMLVGHALKNPTEDGKASSDLISIRENAIKNATYSLDLIRTTSKDVDVKAVSCGAKLIVTVPDFGGAEMQTSYMVQYTSEGKLYVEMGF
jgi:hypothetical protein